MRFKWKSGKAASAVSHRFYIDLEYELRSRITRFLINYLDGEEFPDTRELILEVDLVLGRITLAPETLAYIDPGLHLAFDREINRGYLKKTFAARLKRLNESS